MGEKKSKSWVAILDLPANPAQFHTKMAGLSMLIMEQVDPNRLKQFNLLNSSGFRPFTLGKIH